MGTKAKAESDALPLEGVLDAINASADPERAPALKSFAQEMLGRATADFFADHSDDEIAEIIASVFDLLESTSPGDIAVRVRQRPDFGHWGSVEVLTSDRPFTVDTGTWKRRQISETTRTFSIETGWPPPELFVIVSMTSGTALRPSCSSSFSNAATSMFPLNGNDLSISRDSGQGRSNALAPLYSILARVVSKCVLFGTTCPAPHITAKRIRSAARP